MLLFFFFHKTITKKSLIVPKISSFPFSPFLRFWSLDGVNKNLKLSRFNQSIGQIHEPLNKIVDMDIRSGHSSPRKPAVIYGLKTNGTIRKEEGLRGLIWSLHSQFCIS